MEKETKTKKIKKPKNKKVCDSLEALNDQILKLKISLSVAESMQKHAQLKFNKQQEQTNIGKKKSIKRQTFH